MSIEEQVREIMARITHVEQSIITRESTFKDIKADSLDVVQALAAVEETFGIEIPDEEAQKFENFGDFVSYVERQVPQQERV
ncbi:MAG: acyl carrier protein [Dehalococcoidia bacterium]|jgi:acyl carrier protein